MTAPVQQPYVRGSLGERIQLERNAAIEAEWRQIERITRILATTLDAVAAELGKAREMITWNRSAAAELVDEQRECVAEVAAQLRTARVNPDRNDERKASEAQRIGTSRLRTRT
jgi:hypothetical protein